MSNNEVPVAQPNSARMLVTAVNLPESYALTGKCFVFPFTAVQLGYKPRQHRLVRLRQAADADAPCLILELGVLGSLTSDQADRHWSLRYWTVASCAENGMNLVVLLMGIQQAGAPKQSILMKTLQCP